MCSMPCVVLCVSRREGGSDEGGGRAYDDCATGSDELVEDAQEVARATADVEDSGARLELVKQRLACSRVHLLSPT